MNTPAMSHFSLKAERTNDCILLTQRDSQGKINEVRLNPWQLRDVCQHFDLVAADPQAAKTIATLQRRMVSLRDRIDKLGYYMVNFSDHKHADFSHEMDTLDAIYELANEWCADFEDSPETPARAATNSPPAATDTPDKKDVPQ